MAVVYKFGRINSYQDAASIIRNPDLTRVSECKPGKEIKDKSIFVFRVNEKEEYWRTDGKQWRLLRTRELPRNSLPKLWIVKSYVLMNDGVKVDFQRDEYYDHGACFNPKTNWIHPYVLVHYHGSFKYNTASNKGHGNTKSKSNTAAAKRAVDLVSKGTPTKGAVPYVSADNETPNKDIPVPKHACINESSSDDDFVPIKHKKIPRKDLFSSSDSDGNDSNEKQARKKHKSETDMNRRGEDSVPVANEPDDINIDMDSIRLSTSSDSDVDADHTYATKPANVPDKEESLKHSRPHVTTDKAVVKMLEDCAKSGMKPSQAYRSVSIRQSFTNIDEHPSLMPRNREQAKYQRKKAIQELIHDDLYSLYAFDHDCPGFIHYLLLKPYLGVIIGLEETLKHFKTLWSCNKFVFLHYDTQYTKGPYYLSTLAVRHRALHKDPVIPILFFFHQFSDAEPHKCFFEQARKLVPEIDTTNTVIVTDREKSIRSAIFKKIPNARNLLCWYHIAQNIRRWCTTRFNKSTAGAYASQVLDLLHSEDLQMYTEKRDEYMNLWDSRFTQYFIEYQNMDIMLNARWNLESYGIYDRQSGLTNNASESVNAIISGLLNNENTRITVAVNALYLKQSHDLLEIRRAYLRDEGTFQLKENIMISSVYIPTNVRDIVDPAVIVPMLEDGKIPSDLNVIKLRKLPELKDLTSIKGLAKFLVMKDRVKNVAQSGVWIVKGFNDNNFTVDLKKRSCSCQRKGWCEHFYAVLEAANLTGCKIVPLNDPGGLGAIYKRKCAKTTGKKGPSRGRIRHRKAWNTDRPIDETDNTQEADSDKSEEASETEGISLQDMSKAPDTMSEPFFEEDMDMRENSEEEYEENIEMERDRGTRGHGNEVSETNQLIYTTEDVLKFLPRATEYNVSTVCLKGMSGSIRLAEILSLKEELGRDEIAALNKYSLLTLKQQFTQNDVGWLTDDIILEFVKTLIDPLKNVIYLECWETLWVLGKLTTKHHAKEVSVPEILQYSSKNKDRWSELDKVLMLYPKNLDHYVLFCVMPKNLEILVMDPQKSTELAGRMKTRLTTLLNPLVGRDPEEDWKIIYPALSTKPDTMNCGVLCCFYVECLVAEKSLLSKLNTYFYRCHILNVISKHCKIWELQRSDKLCAVCGNEEQDGNSPNLEWVQCNRCLRWTHVYCAGLSANVAKKKGFKFNCVQDEHS